MKKLTMDEWEEKNIVGQVKRFDQKFFISNRFCWDHELINTSKDATHIGFGKIRDKPGYSLEELALHWASRRGTILELFNNSKPNPNSVVTAVDAAIKNSNPRLQPVNFKPPQGVRVDTGDPQRLSRNLKKVARYFGADLVGICKLDKRWVYSSTYEGEGTYHAGGSDTKAGISTPLEVPSEFQYAIVMCFEEEYNMLKFFPSYIDNAAASMGYSRMAFSNLFLSSYIRNLGFQAVDCTTNDVAINAPIAIQAGLGELGRNGLLITPEFGPRVRISKVLTDMPLDTDTPIEFGVTDFCNVCKKCAVMCPSQSIHAGERTAQPRTPSNSGGVLKWPVNPETCRMYWARMSKSCTICIASCPYSKPYTYFHRFVRWCTDHMRWANPLYVKLDDVLGYGKPQNPENFWEEWQPKRHVKS